MKISFDLSERAELVDALNQVSSLTDKAHLRLDNVTYDKEAQRVILPMSRRSISGYKTTLFRSRPTMLYDAYQRIECVVTINKVVDFEETRLMSDQVKTITILFGLKFKSKTISIESADELSGEVLYRLRMRVEDVDLRLEDAP